MDRSYKGSRTAGPKRRAKHLSYDESVDEAPALIESEPVDVEGAVPAGENDAVEQVEQPDDAPVAFNEGAPGRDEPHE